MRVKSYLCLALCLGLLTGCETGKRLAPPGFFKYEDIAGDIPVNPEIQARKAALDDDGKAAFPVLSSAPSVKPKAPPKATRNAEAVDLLAEREKLSEEIAAIRQADAADRAAEISDLEARRDALDDAVAGQRQRAATERRDRPQ